MDLFKNLTTTERTALEAKWADYYWNWGLLVHELIGVPYLDPWQRKGLWAGAHHRFCEFIGGTGVGKETIAAWGMIAFTLTRAFPKVMAQSVSGGQMRGALWQELAKWIDYSPLLGKLLEWHETQVVVRGYEERWRMWQQIAGVRTSESGHQAEGAAGMHADSMFTVLSEATGLSDALIDARVMGQTKPDNRLWLLCNPVKCEGRAYEFDTTPALRSRRLGDNGWWSQHISQFDSSFVDHAAAHDMVRRLGRNDVRVKTKVFAEWPEGIATNTAFTGTEVEAMFRRILAPDEPGTLLQIGVDVARMGSDETCVYTRRGCRILAAQWEGQTTGPEVAQMAFAEAFRWWRRPYDDPREGADAVPSSDELKQMQREVLFVVDETGLGGPIIDVMRDLGWIVVGVNNGADPREPHRYKNCGSEMWLEDARRWASYGYCREDPELKKQLTTRRYEYTGEGEQRRIEPKDKMRRKGRRSPDRGDAFVLATAEVDAPGLEDWGRAISFG